MSKMSPAKYERKERRKCSKKEAFKTVLDAGNKVREILVQSKKMLRPYECVWCGNIHLTSGQKREENEV